MNEVQIDQEISVALYCKEGSADKVYQAALVATDGGWNVEFAYGKRGSTLKTGTKTSVPIDFEKARKVYEKLVAEKKAKGYTEEQSGKTYARSDNQGRVSGFLPQLPTAIDEQTLDAVLNDDDWVLQQKRDGENRMLFVNNSTVQGVNRKGLFVDIPTEWVELYAGLPDCLIAGEAVGSMFYAFDLLEFDGVDMRNTPFSARWEMLDSLKTHSSFARFSQEKTGLFSVIPMVATTFSKKVFFETIRVCHGEGGVFKKLDAPFEQGRSKLQLKYKFTESATCIVLEINTQRSVRVGLIEESGNCVSLGNVTIPENEQIPTVDDLVEVRYLYRFEDGCFEQPVYLGKRNDIDRFEAKVSQITRIKAKSV